MTGTGLTISIKYVILYIEKEGTKMLQFIEKIENNAIHKYGFESKKTILTFKITEILRRF